VTVERRLVAERKREHGQTRHYVSDGCAKKARKHPPRGGLGFAVGEIAMAKRKQPDSQTDLLFSRFLDTSPTVEIHCGNCGAKFVAFYGTEDEAGTETVETEKCGLCGGDPFKRDNFKDSVRG
jgi:hypothetical protein